MSVVVAVKVSGTLETMAVASSKTMRYTTTDSAFIQSVSAIWF